MHTKLRVGRRPAYLAVAGLALAFAGCGPGTTETPPTNAAMLLVVNGAASSVTATAPGASAVTLAPGALSGPLNVTAGAQVVRLTAAGQAAVDVPVTAQAGHTTVVAARVAANNTLAGQTVVDTGAIAPAGASKLRVIHLAAGYGDLQIERTQPDYDSPVGVMFPFPYGAASSYIQSKPGTWEVRVGPWATPQAKLSLTIGDAQTRTVVVLADSAKRMRIEPLP